MNRPMILNLGTLEIATLDCVWEIGEGDVRRVHSEIGVPRGVTSNTIQSTLERLCRKGFLNRRKVSHAFVYFAAVDRAGLVGCALEAVLSQITSGETGSALTAFVDFAARKDEAALKALERLVAERLSERNTLTERSG